MQLSRKWFGALAALALALGVAACDEDANGAVGPQQLSAPVNVTVVEENGALVVSWSVVTGASGYTVERSVENAGFSAIATGLGTTTHTDADVEPAVDYRYRVLATAAGQTSPPSETVIGEIEFCPLSGDISGTVTLDAGCTYLLSGVVNVQDGGVLEIPAGTLILGNADVAPSALIVRRGGQLFAEGTATAPVVFTSSRPVGERRRGDWSGVVLNGRSLCNFPAADCVAEGIGTPYGGNDPEDSSGRLAYVRIEFAGFEVSFGNELNALTLNAVGRGTELHHIQTHYGLDDGFEWFGGTVNGKYLLATGISDDSFDMSTGFAGYLQWLVAQQDPDDADRGFENDNNEQDHDALPRTSPMIWNVTIVGKQPGTGTEGESTNGITFRRGYAGMHGNFIIVGAEHGVEIDNSSTFSRCAAGALTMNGLIAFDNGALLDDDSDPAGPCVDSWRNVQQADPLLGDPYDLVAPEFTPQPGSPALVAANCPAPPDNGFFDQVSICGGVDPDDPWTGEGWITFADR